jgi:hypothetical protein
MNVWWGWDIQFLPLLGSCALLHTRTHTHSSLCPPPGGLLEQALAAFLRLAGGTLQTLKIPECSLTTFGLQSVIASVGHPLSLTTLDLSWCEDLTEVRTHCLVPLLSCGCGAAGAVVLWCCVGGGRGWLLGINPTHPHIQTPMHFGHEQLRLGHAPCPL